jgi:hypothetical protein
MFSGSNLSINQLINSRLSSDFAATYGIPLNPIFCIVVRIEGVNAALMNDLISEGEHLATWECATLFGCNNRGIISISLFFVMEIWCVC